MDSSCWNASLTIITSALAEDLPPLAEDVILSVPRVCLSVCLSGFTQGTLYTTTTVYGVLVHRGAYCA